MREGPLFDQIQSGDALFYKAIRLLILLSGVFLLAFTGILELTWPQQIVLGILTVALVIWMDRSSGSYLVTLTLMLASMFSTFRYGFWRVSTTLKFFRDPGSTWSILDGFFICLLLFAEIYAFVVLFLGFFQTLWPLRRTPVSLPDEITEWPAVDLLIPTYNEPLNVVKYTALAALNIDWPSDRLNVYLLDDGKREEFRQFAADAGIGYMTRDDNQHAKAGNINHALVQLNSPYVVIFDCDHVPTRSFLQITMGWFLRDQKLGMLQTPHHFYSPDPFERNLDQFRTIPNEGELFNGIVQDGNDFWNATFFCGSCAVIRRSALDQIGGIAVETVTEDAHTSLRMQRNGWNTAYINIPQAAGLATERLSGHIRQRIRWARGMVQILRTENPLFAGGLSLAQRLCYFNAMTHFLYALPRLIFLTAPLVYLIFGHVNLPGYWLLIFAYALPHLALANIANSRIQGQHRHSFWNQIYETVLAPYIFLPTLFALLNPRFGNFDVTAKGGVVTRRFFDSRIAQPFLFLSGLNAIGILCAIPRFIQFPGAGTPSPLHFIADMYDGGHPGTILMNLLWACFNMVILGVATSVAWESRQRRQSVRLPMSVPADVQLGNGTIVRGVTSDMSSGGLMVRIERAFTARIGDAVKLTLPVLDGSATLPATVVGIEGNAFRAQFAPLTLLEEEALTLVLYSRADTWLGWGESREADRPLTSLRRIVHLAGHGFARTFRSGAKAKEQKSSGELASSVVPLLVLVVLFCSSTLSAQIHPLHSTHFLLQNNSSTSPPAQTAPSAQTQPPVPAAPAPSAPAAQIPSSTETQQPPQNSPAVKPFLSYKAYAARLAAAQSAAAPPDTFDKVVSLTDLGVPRTIVMQGLDAFNTIHFALPQTQVVKTATMHLRYHVSPGLIPSLSHIKVSLNGTLFAALPVIDPHSASTTQATQTVTNPVPTQSADLLEATVTLPVDTLTRDNQLTFEFVGHYASQCEDPAHSTLWAHIDNNSTIEFTGTLTQLHDDLRLLPAPFYDPLVNPHPVIPIVFLGQPSPKALQAAGIIASWFGILADSRPIRFPVTVETIPVGNAIVIGQNGPSFPAALQINSIAGPTVVMRPNPSDPYSKLLILTGETDSDLLNAALALTLQRDLLSGDRVRIPAIKMPAPREADDAPRWLSTDRNTPIGDLLQTSSLQTDGSNPVALSLRLPPDLFYGTRQNLGFHLTYRYNGVPLSDDSSLQVYLNDAYINSTPLSHTDKAAPARIVPIPVSDMRPFSNSILLRFFFQLAKKPDCPDPASPNLQGSILKDSYLDLRDIPHLAVLPNLEIFANAGYPFTRKADLSDTAVVLPDNPSPEEIELYLTLMAHFGAQTGYPVLNVTVTNAEGMRTDAHKDYLVLGTVDDQPAISRLNPSLPVSVDGSGLHIQDTQDFFAQLQHAWWKVRSSDHIQSGQLETAGSIPDALIEGVEWPSGSSQSVVVIALRDKTVIPNFLSTFLQTSQSSDISQSVSVLRDSHFISYRIGNDVYRVGSLSLWLQLNMLFADYQWLMVISTLVVCFLLAVILRSALRRRARARLQGNTYTHPA
ncbi:UDP-forming cellulose synthase catalytic subunit [Tunturiibacter empetritectus]|uniref:Cellulose synthase catalytic subunit [UDP-forming] n=1 Tax=Tunturiibacter lichenicola TaxID=2051959 RepID=A0A852VIZ1_9BACT|nr:UDP-forming cellulose synthase catalytic subunit [Edaphobacter lichenicola]NYF89476.1 cellulose synthase (UDP-forming) [Edaphobacter lichenicola]